MITGRWLGEETKEAMADRIVEMVRREPRPYTQEEFDVLAAARYPWEYWLSPDLVLVKEIDETYDWNTTEREEI